jgi:hypothetical protein
MKTFKHLAHEMITKVDEDAPTNAVGTGANVALPPTHEPGVDKKKKKKKHDPILINTLKRKVEENNDNNSTMLKGVLDKLEHLDNIVDEVSGVKKNFISDEVKNKKEYITFKDKYVNVSEAYSFFPTTEEEISARLKGFTHQVVVDITNLFKLLKGGDATPINIDMKKPNFINVSRIFQGFMDITDIRKRAGLKAIKIKFGNGSKGNRGANNRGNLFEKQFADAIELWYAEGDVAVADKDLLRAIKDLDKTYNLGKSKTFDAKVVGGENTKRPLDFSGKISITNPTGVGFNIGQSVTDITLMTDNNPPIYLSLKLGGTTTFFNVGIKTKLTKKEIDEGEILNVDGRKLLDLFGIDNKRFCTIFNPDVKTESGVVNGRPDASALAHLLQSGIGFGYHVIHKIARGIISKKMDESEMKESARVGAVKIFYGGKGGSGKRIDIEMESKFYMFKINIRDTQGTDGYPTRMMCDFKPK